MRKYERRGHKMLTKLVNSSGWTTLLVSALAFGLYVIRPRMSAMMVQQAKIKGLNLYAVIVLGALVSIPLFLVLSGILIRYGMEWAIIFAAVGDFAAAAPLGLVDLKSGIELAIITVFVYVGIRLAPWISELILPQ
jgi:hypothetical protein